MDLLEQRINPEHIEVTAVPPKQAEELYTLLEQHLKATGSSRAEAILNSFDESLPLFKMVIPIEYKKHLTGY